MAKSYDRKTQRFIGYYDSAPGCGLLELMDPIYQLYPVELEHAQPGGFYRVFCKEKIRSFFELSGNSQNSLISVPKPLRSIIDKILPNLGRSESRVVNEKDSILFCTSL
jgi:hypothetical protein